MLRRSLFLAVLVLSACSGGQASNAGPASRAASNSGPGDPMPSAQMQSSQDADGNTFRSAVPRGTVPASAPNEPKARPAPKILVVAPPSYQMDPPPTPDQARQAIWDAIQARHAAAAKSNAAESLSDEAAQTLMSQTTADACTSTALSLAVCRVKVGDKAHWLRFRLAGNGVWAVDGLSMPPPGAPAQ